MTTDPYRAAAVNLAIDQAQREGILNQTHFRYIPVLTQTLSIYLSSLVQLRPQPTQAN